MGRPIQRYQHLVPVHNTLSFMGIVVMQFINKAVANLPVRHGFQHLIKSSVQIPVFQTLYIMNGNLG